MYRVNCSDFEVDTILRGWQKCSCIIFTRIRFSKTMTLIPSIRFLHIVCRLSGSGLCDQPLVVVIGLKLTAHEP